MNRRQAITAGMAGAGTLLIPTAARGSKRHMGPRFYAKLWVRHDGIAIHAAGPVGTWKWDTTYGYVAAVIVQNGVKGHGMSARIHRDDSHWHARVLVDRHRFHHGPAVAHGVLLIPDGRSAYSYAWTVPVELVKR